MPFVFLQKGDLMSGLCDLSRCTTVNSRRRNRSRCRSQILKHCSRIDDVALTARDSSQQLMIEVIYPHLLEFVRGSRHWTGD